MGVMRCMLLKMGRQRHKRHATLPTQLCRMSAKSILPPKMTICLQINQGNYQIKKYHAQTMSASTPKHHFRTQRRKRYNFSEGLLKREMVCRWFWIHRYFIYIAQLILGQNYLRFDISQNLFVCIVQFCMVSQEIHPLQLDCPLVASWDLVGTKS